MKLYNKIIIFDFETSGLDGEKNQPIEIGAIKIENGKKVSEMDILVKLRSGKLDRKITELTGITDDMLAVNGVDENEACKIFVDFIGNDEKTLFIAHNAQFDLSFLMGMLNRCGQTLNTKIDALDSLTVYKDRASYPHKLCNAIQFYKIEEAENSHRAIDDVRALYKVVAAMCKEKDDLDKYINLFGYNVKYGVSGKKLDFITYSAQPFDSYEPFYERVRKSTLNI